MKRTKQLLAGLLAVMMLTLTVALCASTAAAASVLDSGTIEGSNLTWSIDSEGTLTVSGNGQIPDLHYYYRQFPWDAYTVKTVVIENGITIIPDYAFNNCHALEKAYIPSSVVTIVQDAFFWCENLRNIYYEGTQSEWEARGFSTSLEKTTGMCSGFNVYYSSKMPSGTNAEDSPITFGDDEEDAVATDAPAGSKPETGAVQNSTDKTGTSPLVIAFIAAQLLFDAVLLVYLKKRNAPAGKTMGAPQEAPVEDAQRVQSVPEQPPVEPVWVQPRSAQPVQQTVQSYPAQPTQIYPANPRQPAPPNQTPPRQER
ncbi:MAG: leucine-rich repeat protein [Clostridia bacterium]|nr:leucine-rich repeat protein [Clostridia bacterium]